MSSLGDFPSVRNFDSPPLVVFHKDLFRSDDSAYRSKCLACDGTVYRILGSSHDSGRLLHDWIREWNPFVDTNDALELAEAMGTDVSPIRLERMLGKWIASQRDKFESAATVPEAMTNLVMSLLGL